MALESNSTDPYNTAFHVTDDNGWLAEWQYRKTISISGTKGAGTNYQIKIVVHYGEGTDNGNDVYLAEYCQEDFGDVRFTNSNSSQLLSYWIESMTRSSVAIFWVKVSDDLDANQVIYIYYGAYSDKEAIASGDSTFLFFDDFQSTVVDWTHKWTSSSHASYTQEFGYLKCTQPALDTGFIRTKEPVPEHSRVVYRVRTAFTDIHRFYQYFTNETDSWQGGTTYTTFSSYYDKDVRGSISYGGKHTNGSVGWTPNVWATVEIQVDNAYASITVSQGASRWTISGFDASYGSNERYWKFLYWSMFEAHIDSIYITKFIYNGPSISAFGNEESVPLDDLFVILVNPATIGHAFVVVGAILICGTIGILKLRSSQYSLFRKDGDQSAKDESIPLELDSGGLRSESSRELPSIRQSAADDDVMMESLLASKDRPRVFEATARSDTGKGPIKVASGFDVVGEYLKLAIKVENTTDLIITDVEVVLNIPDAFEFVRNTSRTQALGNIAGHSFESAIFWLRPLRCVDSEYGGTILYVDAHGEQQVVKIPTKRLVNICPMLTATERADEVFSRLKSGALARNCSSFEFSGNAHVVLKMAEARLSGLTPVDRSDQEFEDGTYLGYACYVGQTKYGESQFAAEIQVSGTPQGGVLTISIYSDDERILSGFFVDIMYDIREHIEIIKEKMCPIATCPKCGAPIDLTKVGPDRIYKCDYCGTMGKASPWLD
ncbi:MAG: DUF2341 domain-containing protein [Candidatus Thorarchaeota archaeon]